jgi:quercetin dioxygenase-like cupin family protein
MVASESTRADRVIVNPLSGERVAIRRPAGTGEAVLVWELTLAPGGHVPSRHRHPNQQESFTVLDGLVRFQVGYRHITAGPGDTVRVAPGAVHHFANPGRVPARVSVETTPALEMEALLEVAAAMAQDQHSAGRRFPRPIDLAGRPTSTPATAHGNNTDGSNCRVGPRPHPTDRSSSPRARQSPGRSSPSRLTPIDGPCTAASPRTSSATTTGVFAWPARHL